MDTVDQKTCAGMTKSAAEPAITGFFDPATSSVSYLVADREAGEAAIIDPVLDFDTKAGRTKTTSADRLLAAAEGLSVQWILETHTHADHLTAADYLKARTGAKTATGAFVRAVQKTWAAIYNLGPDFVPDGSQFDRLLEDGDRLSIGSLLLTAWHTPGHTPSCMTYVVEGAAGTKHAFVGDTLFMPDYGTARADFPGGDARTLYRSIRRILDLPPTSRLYMCHDYQPGGRPVRWDTSVADQRAQNPHVKDGISEDEYVAFRTKRDKTLDAPALILPSIQVNIRAGRLPAPESNGTSYLKIPLNRI